MLIGEGAELAKEAGQKVGQTVHKAAQAATGAAHHIRVFLPPFHAHSIR